MNSIIKSINLIKKDDVPRDTNVYFIIEFYKQKPHWDSEYYDVLSGCKDTFEAYRNAILKDKTSVKASFELRDFENALFRFDYKKYGINPVDIAYIKIIDDKGIFQGANWKNTYFFVTNVSFMSTEIAVLTGQLDIWMTYWPQLEFNGKSIKCLRKHMPRYRTDKGHEGEYDFSTDSCVLNVDQLEGQYTNLVSFKNYQLSAWGINNQPLNYFYHKINNSRYAYALAIPKDDDKAATGITTQNELYWEKFVTARDNVENASLKYFFADNNPEGTLNKSPIVSFPYFIFGLSNKNETGTVDLNFKGDMSLHFKNRFTYISYSYQMLSCLDSKTNLSSFMTDHPIFMFEKNSNNHFDIDNLVYIEGISDKMKGEANVEEVCGFSMIHFKNRKWTYKLFSETFATDGYYKPLKIYSENDLISIDQEPALFRTPHFEFEYTIFDIKGMYKIQNELLLSEGWFEMYGNLYCDYILHYATIQKYVYVANGWYKEQSELWRIGLIEENFYGLDLITSAYLAYMQSHQSQFNNSYNQSMINSFLGIVETGVGLALAVPTGGASLPFAVSGALSFANGIKNMMFTQMSREAQIKDLQRTPATRANASGNYGNSASNQMQDWTQPNFPGYLLVRQHRENEQWILYSHFHQNGYLVNKILAVKDLNWFYSRHWFDFFQIEDFTTVIDNTKYSQYILNKFNNLFHRGVRLWHTTEHFLDYSLNNKEIDDWKKVYLKK